MKRVNSHDFCPCGTGRPWSDCCGQFVADASLNATPDTAEGLMRSRFSAFALGDEAYLKATWHPSTRPKALDLGTDIEWQRLLIQDVVGGGPGDAEGVVEFTAVYTQNGKRGWQRERSRFRREDGRWFYVDGDVADH